MAGPDVCVAVLGMGEVGWVLGTDLVAAGARIRVFDPAVRRGPTGAVVCGSAAEAAGGTDLVLSVNSAAVARDVLRAGLSGAGGDTVWADLNTAAASLKRALAAALARAGVGFVDVALMSPVPGHGLRTPMLASGTAAGRFAALLGPLGARVTVLDGPAGLAAEGKLLRSVFVKGLAAALVEALAAARAAGCEDWVRENIIEVLASVDADLATRLEQGSVRHAKRRVAEMAAACELLAELGVPARVSGASLAWLEQLAAGAASAG